MFPKPKVSGEKGGRKDGKGGKSRQCGMTGKGCYETFRAEAPGGEGELPVVSEVESLADDEPLDPGTVPDAPPAVYMECYDEYGWCDTYLVHEIDETQLWQFSMDTDTAMIYRSGGLIDSGASSSVSGQSWVEQWCQGTGMADTCPSDSVFKFGDGRAVKSHCKMRLRCYLASQLASNARIYVEFDVDIDPGSMPLLISYAMLQKWCCRLDFAEGILDVKGEMLVLGVRVNRAVSRK